MSAAPQYLSFVAWLSLAAGLLCAAVVLGDLLRGRRQAMWIMNLVWPLTMLYAGPLGLWLYWRAGRAAPHAAMHHGDGHHHHHAHAAARQRPLWQTVALATTHCGSGCTLGDLLAESLMAVAPLSLFGQRVFGGWLLDYVAALVFGIAFQYFTIQPMRKLSPGAGLRAALKADLASLSAWQVGMYGWMAVALFGLFTPALPKSGPLFWFMMQLAMLAGFATAYPVNRWLIRAGVKEAM